MRSEVLESSPTQKYYSGSRSSNIVLGYIPRYSGLDGWTEPKHEGNFVTKTSSEVLPSKEFVGENDFFDVIATHDQTMVMKAYSEQNDVGHVVSRLVHRFGTGRDSPIAVVERTSLVRNPEAVEEGDELTLSKVEDLASSGYTVILRH